MYTVKKERKTQEKERKAQEIADGSGGDVDASDDDDMPAYLKAMNVIETVW